MQVSFDIPDEPGFVRTRSMFTLFFRPARFFRGLATEGRAPLALLAVWGYGMKEAIDEIDRQIVNMMRGAPGVLYERLIPQILDSWPVYWGTVLAVGALFGGVLWFLGGWWYRLRIVFSGDPDADTFMARRVLAYSALIVTLPTVLFVIGETIVHETYAHAWGKQGNWIWGYYITTFWSVLASYVGVKVIFDVSAPRAAVWFLFGPATFYALRFSSW